jgi:hypothetical protein
MLGRICRICGEVKETIHFNKIPNSIHLLPKNVIWCRDCQKLWLYKKKTSLETMSTVMKIKPDDFIVSFS